MLDRAHSNAADARMLISKSEVVALEDRKVGRRGVCHKHLEGVQISTLKRVEHTLLLESSQTSAMKQCERKLTSMSSI
jgi:hypothetical protein